MFGGPLLLFWQLLILGFNLLNNPTQSKNKPRNRILPLSDLTHTHYIRSTTQLGTNFLGKEVEIYRSCFTLWGKCFAAA